MMVVGTRPRDTTSIAFWRIVWLLVCEIEERTERPSFTVATGLILPVAMSDIFASSSDSSWYMPVLKGASLEDVLNSCLKMSEIS